MLNELSRYENLGTPGYFYELFTLMRDTAESWNREAVQAHFHNRIVDNVAVFDGCLPMAEAVGAISVDAGGRILINPSLVESLVNVGYFTNRMLVMVVEAAKKDDVFQGIFCAENISYDIVYRTVQMENSAFQFRYGNFRRLLVSFEFLSPHPDRNINKLIVAKKHMRLFDLQLLPEIKKRKIGITELEKMLAQRQLYGKDAEEYVLHFERNRLASHPNLGKVEIISDYDVSAGFDVVSFDSVGSQEHDRFIEVKSFIGRPGFHWSRNEIDVARIKKERYYLYLVDRDKMKRPDYAPLIIQNPHEAIIENASGWDRRIEGYYVTQAQTLK